MVQRKIFPAYGGYDIQVACEQMRDGKWAAVATITHSTESARRTIDLPVSPERFESEEEAEQFVVNTARQWIDHNVVAADEPIAPSRAA